MTTTLTTSVSQDYSVYQKLAAGMSVNILIIGDSIGAGGGASSEEQAWDYLLEQMLNETWYSDDGTSPGTSGKTLSTSVSDTSGQSSAGVTLTNISLSGNSSYAGYVSTMLLDDGISYDLAILCYGQNDAEDDFALFYEAIIRAVMNKYPDCSILSILESSQQTYTEKILKTQTLCSYYGIPTVDTIAAFNDSGHTWAELTSDGIHPTDLGQQVYAEAIAQVIAAQVDAGTGLPSYPSPYDSEVTEYDHLVVYAAGDETSDGTTTFVRTTDTVYTINTSVAGISGLDFDYDTGDAMVEIYVDGAIYPAPVVISFYDFTQRYILTIGEECQVKSEIQVVFGTEEQADGFNGMFFSW